jgi:hypothetical protein
MPSGLLGKRFAVLRDLCKLGVNGVAPDKIKSEILATSEHLCGTNEFGKYSSELLNYKVVGAIYMQTCLERQFKTSIMAVRAAD